MEDVSQTSLKTSWFVGTQTLKLWISYYFHSQKAQSAFKMYCRVRTSGWKIFFLPHSTLSLASSHHVNHFPLSKSGSGPISGSTLIVIKYIGSRNTRQRNKAKHMKHLIFSWISLAIKDKSMKKLLSFMARDTVRNSDHMTCKGSLGPSTHELRKMKKNSKHNQKTKQDFERHP